MNRPRPARRSVLALAAAATAAITAPPLAAQSPGSAPPTPATRAQATAAVGAAPAAASGRFTADRMLDFERVSAPQISPDGRRVVYTRGFVNKMTDRWESALWLVNAAGEGAGGSRHHFLVKGSGAQWSPDGTRLAYVAEGEPKGAQIFVRYMDAGGATSQVTRITEPPGDIQWSPDGRSIAFTAFVAQPSEWRIAMPSAPTGATWTPAPKHVTALHYRQDRKGFDRTGSTHLFVVSADGGTPRQLTTGPGHVGYRFDGQASGVDYAWTPDGRTLVAEGMLDSTTDANYRGSNLYAVDVGSGATRVLTPQRGTWRAPELSPDGRTVAFVGHPDTRASYQAEPVWTMPLAGGQAAARMLSGAPDDDASDLAWTGDGRGPLLHRRPARRDRTCGTPRSPAAGSARPARSPAVRRCSASARWRAAAASAPACAPRPRSRPTSCASTSPRARPRA
jgi:Tol biopolymer transport system component